MDRLISEQAVIKILILLFIGSENFKVAINSIKAIPSAELKTGYWRHYEGMLICSECGDEFYDDIMEYCGDDVPKCCPNCGAKMVEEQENEKINCKAIKCENCKNHNYCDYEP